MLDIGVMIIIKVTLFEIFRVSLYNCYLICHYITKGEKVKRLWIVIFLLFLLCCFNVISYADGDSTNEEWNPVSVGPATTWTAPLCEKGQLVIQPFFFYNRTRGSFDSDGHYHSLPSGDNQYQYQELLFLQYGITDWLEFCAQAEYEQNYTKQGDAQAHSNGFGDTYLFLRSCLHEEKGWLPYVAGVFQVKAPTGKYQHADSDKLGTDLTGNGSWDYGFGFNLSKKIRPFWLHADAIYSFPQKVRVDGVSTRYDNYLNYDLGAEYFLPHSLNLLFEVNGFLQGDMKKDGKKIYSSDERYLTICPGIGWSCDKIQTLLAYQRVVAGTNTDANDSVVFTCVYSF